MRLCAFPRLLSGSAPDRPRSANSGTLFDTNASKITLALPFCDTFRTVCLYEQNGVQLYAYGGQFGVQTVSWLGKTPTSSQVSGNRLYRQPVPNCRAIGAFGSDCTRPQPRHLSATMYLSSPPQPTQLMIMPPIQARRAEPNRKAPNQFRPCPRVEAPKAPCRGRNARLATRSFAALTLHALARYAVTPRRSLSVLTAS